MVSDDVDTNVIIEKYSQNARGLAVRLIFLPLSFFSSWKALFGIVADICWCITPFAFASILL